MGGKEVVLLGRDAVMGAITTLRQRVQRREFCRTDCLVVVYLLSGIPSLGNRHFSKSLLAALIDIAVRDLDRKFEAGPPSQRIGIFACPA
jgi:hypothetical protein